MHSSLLTMSILLLVSAYIGHVHCRFHPSVEEMASDYIISRLFPSHSLLASKLLNAITKEDGYQQQHHKQQQQQQPQYQVVDDDGSDDDDDDDEGDDVVDDDVDINDGDDDVDNESSSSSHGNVLLRDDVEESGNGVVVGRRSGLYPLTSGRQTVSRARPLATNVVGLATGGGKRSFGRRLRRLQTKRFSMGRCISRCINGRRGMSFLQCKSMCH